VLSPGLVGKKEQQSSTDVKENKSARAVKAGPSFIRTNPASALSKGLICVTASSTVLHGCWRLAPQM